MPGLTETAMVACLFFIFLVPLAAAGLALINAGLGRSHSAVHIMMSSLSALSVAGLVYFVCGFGWQGYIGSPGHVLMISGKAWSWIASEPFFFRKLVFDGSGASLAALLQMFCVGLAAMIPLGSGADRWRLRACCLSAAVLAGWTYPLFAHWFGVEAGSRSSVLIMGWVTDFLTLEGPVQSRCWAASQLCR